MIHPYLLAENNWKSVRELDYSTVVLPWGATEAHNYHLPYATDNYQVDWVAKQSAHLAWDQGAKAVVLPCIPFGVNTGQLDIKLCMNLLPSTQLAILKDICDVVNRAGIKKFVILNGHGGNSFKSMVRELSFSFPELFVSWIDWWRAVDKYRFFEEKGDHADEMETSVMMHIAPQYCLPLQEAGPGYAKKFALQGLQQGWAISQRAWTQVTEDTGVGNPYKATAEKGNAFLSACTQNISQYLVELHRLDMGSLYV